MQQPGVEVRDGALVITMKEPFTGEIVFKPSKPFEAPRGGPLTPAVGIRPGGASTSPGHRAAVLQHPPEVPLARTSSDVLVAATGEELSATPLAPEGVEIVSPTPGTSPLSRIVPLGQSQPKDDVTTLSDRKRAPSAGAGAPPKAQRREVSCAPLVTAPPAVVAAAMSAGFRKLATGGDTPEARWGHQAVLDPSGSKIIVYGGDNADLVALGDTTLLDLDTLRWSVPLNCASETRVWHAAAFVPKRNMWFVFGGERDIGTGTNDVVGNLMCFDTSICIWYPPAVTGLAPTGRAGHTLTAVNDSVVLFGGTRKRKWVSELHVLDLATYRWRIEKPTGTQPCSRSYAAAAALDDTHIMFVGGNNSDECFNDVHVLAVRSPGTWSWFKPITTGKAPCPRTGLSLTQVTPTVFLVYGGWDPEDGEATPFSDAFLLDTEAWEWTVVDLPVLTPPVFARTGHTATLAKVKGHGTGVVIAGGVDSEETRSGDVLFLPVDATTA